MLILAKSRIQRGRIPLVSTPDRHMMRQDGTRTVILEDGFKWRSEEIDRLALYNVKKYNTQTRHNLFPILILDRVCALPMLAPPI